ncbi:MAG: hypothetical protein ACE366_29990 [Bradymonadia bacterium]
MRRPMLLTALLGLLLPIAFFAQSASAQASPNGHGPLDEAHKRLFWDTAEDKAPELLLASRKELQGRHYLTGDERNLHKFHDTIKGIGGAYMGVGTDQAYLFADWMKAELVWLTDYDPWVRHLHWAYVGFFKEADSREAFLGLWEKQHLKKATSLLKIIYAEHPDRDHIIRVFKIARPKVVRRFKRLKATLPKAGIPSFVTDDASYAFIRKLVMADRVRPMLCNLIGEQAMKGLGDASRALGVPIRVLYVSNAEEYWPFKKVYRENIKALNFAEDGWLLRTVASMKSNGDYRYNAHLGRNFQEWLDQPWVKRVRDVVPWTRLKEDEIPLTITRTTPPPPAERKKRRRR